MMRRILFVLALSLPGFAAAAQEAISVFSQTVPLDPRDPKAKRAGELEFRGGIALRSTDPRFGGFSGIHVSTDGRSLLAISDRGSWMRLALRYDRAGRLVGAAEAEIGALIGEDGNALTGTNADAEAMTVMPDGSILVAFERRHRILHYPEADPPFSKAPTEYPVPDGLAQAPPNGGLEAIVHVGRGFVVAVTERLSVVAGAVDK